MELGPITPKRLSGSESFYSDRGSIGSVSDFWAWNGSDLLSNVTRGRIAEYLIAKALGIATDFVRNEWDAWDLQHPNGLKIEVKSAAHLQSWRQLKLSPVSFSIRKAQLWSSESGASRDEPKRHADLYIFALLHHQDKSSVNPLDLSQWSFWMVPTSILDKYERSQTSITLRSLERVAGNRLAFHDLQVAFAKLS
jgi:hypothetical protein